MAFSYSDKNFTVVGNLCFVHIKTDTAGAKSFDIPPAVRDRMLVSNLKIIACTSLADLSSPGYIFVTVTANKIAYTATNPNVYVSFYFPIDSNK